MTALDFAGRTMKIDVGLQTKTFLVVFALVVTLGAFAFHLQAQLLHEFELTMTEALNMPLASRIADELRAQGLARADSHGKISASFARLMNINPNIEIYLIGGQGEIAAFSAPAGEVKLQRVDLAPIRAFVANAFVYPILAADPKRPGAQKAFSAAPLDPADDSAGYVFVILGGAEFEAAGKRIEADWLVRSGLTIAVVGTLAGLAAMLYMRVDVVAKLKRLLAAMSRFEWSGFREPPPPIGAEPRWGDEIDAVAGFFCDMAAHMRMLLGQLEATDRNRRELFLNVAHDLRAPLASARAHVESLAMKGEAYSADQRAQYLATTIQQLDQITRFADELFELGRLDAPDAVLARELFPLADLVQDVAQKFAVAAREHGISLTVDRGDDIPRVRGDMALIERALDNLIDNAIRHTPPGGAIQLGVMALPHAVVLTVRDNGEGIAEAHLPFIFDRFYRAPGPSTGAGLGLAIVKRIVEMHAGTVAVESRLGGGACFSIELPRDV